MPSLIAVDGENSVSNNTEMMLVFTSDVFSMTQFYMQCKFKAFSLVGLIILTSLNYISVHCIVKLTYWDQEILQSVNIQKNILSSLNGTVTPYIVVFESVLEQ